jgi:prepilin signal peptidase PulO-like enzyme (type II secretory pathway)
VGFNPDGLEKKDLEEIRDFYKKGLFDFESLKISRTIPLAPILFIGAILTYYFSGSIKF